MTIRIDAVDYRVEETSEPIIVDGVDSGGSVDFNKALIQVSTKIGDGKKSQVLMHEIVHGILHSRCREEVWDEGLVEALANGFLAFIRDNPGLVASFVELADLYAMLADLIEKVKAAEKES